MEKINKRLSEIAKQADREEKFLDFRTKHPGLGKMFGKIYFMCGGSNTVFLYYPKTEYPITRNEEGRIVGVRETEYSHVCPKKFESTKEKLINL